MNNKEFHNRLKENKWFDKPDELIDYRKPVVQWYLDNEINIGINGQSLRGLQIIYNEEDFTLINQAFLSLRKKYKYDK